MEIKQIKELMTAMTRIGIRRMALKEGDFELTLEREGSEIVKETHYVTEGYRGDNPMLSELEEHRSKHAVARSDKGRVPSAESSKSKADAPTASNGTFITSPMVGTFYASPSPEDPPYVKVGDKVKKGQVVCIVEAMKVMNEVKSEETGVVVEVLVESSHPVEFGTKMFRIDANG